MRVVLSVVLCACGVLVACGPDDSPDSAVQVDAAALAELEELAAAFVPAETVLLVAAPSRNHYEVLMARLDRAWDIDPQGLAQHLKPLGGVPDTLQAEAPLALAFVLDELAELTLSAAFLPCDDPQAAADAHSGGAMVNGRYVVLSHADSLRAGGARIGELRLDADLLVRAELATWLDLTVRQSLETAVAAVESMQQSADAAGPFASGDVMAPMFDTFREALDAVDFLDARVSLVDDTLNLDVSVHTRAGALAADDGPGSEVASLARHIPTSLPTRLVGHGGRSWLAQFTTGMNRAVAGIMAAGLDPEEYDETVAWWVDVNDVAADFYGDEWALGYRMGGVGMNALMVSRIEDGRSVVDRYLDLYAQPIGARLGMLTERLDARQLGGHSVERVRLTMTEEYLGRFAEMTGGLSAAEMGALMDNVMSPDGQVLEFAVVDEFMFFGSSSTGELLDEAALNGAYESDPTRAARLGGMLRLDGVIDLGDFVSMMSGMFANLPGAPQLDADRSLPVGVTMATAEDELRLAVDLPIPAIGELIRDFRN